MNSGRYRVGLVGCGQVSADHVAAWEQRTDVQVVATCDPDLGRAQARAARFDGARIYTEPAAMFAAERLDLVDIMTPRETHASVVRLAHRHGVHALCEKPLCPTFDEAQALVAEVGDGIRLMVNENWRYRTYYTLLGQWVREGRLGTIVHYRIALKRASLIPNPDGTIPQLLRMPFMAHERRLLIAESLVHELDITRSLLGELDVVASRIARTSDAVVGEDVATILLQSRAGVIAVVEGVFTAAGYPVRNGNRLEICGTRCSATLDQAVLRLAGAEEEVHMFDEGAMRRLSFELSIAQFVDCVRSGRPFWTSAADQLQTMRLLDDAYERAGPMHVSRSS